MTLNPKKSPVVYSFLWACGFLLMAACMPVWVSDSTPDRAVPGGRYYFHDTLWGVLALHWKDLRVIGPGFLIRMFPQNIIPVLVAAVIGAILGRLNYTLRWGGCEERRLVGRTAALPKPKQNPLMYSVLGGCGILCIAGWLPIWSVHPWSQRYHSNLFKCLSDVFDEASQPDSNLFIALFGPHLMDLGLVLGVLLGGALLGRLHYWLCWERAVG